jgi:hypothetical protein
MNSIKSQSNLKKQEIKYVKVTKKKKNKSFYKTKILNTE